MNPEAAVLTRACQHATEYLEGLDSRPVATTTGLAELRRRLNVELGASGTPAETIIDELVAATAGGQLGSASGRCFAWVIGGALPSALAADWLASTWDVNATIYACGPAAAVTEEIAGEWVKDVLDLPRDASFAFTTGCQLAHVTCLAAARHAVLARVG
jgi:aromatic-L-amino-acid decarboxylase